MPGAAEIRIKGAAELERAFLQVRREVLVELKPALLEIAETVRTDAQQRAVDEITNIGSRWSRMRLGITIKGAYVAPRSRRRGGSPRKNLAPLLMERAMQPALEAHRAELETRLEQLIAVASRRAGF